MRKVSLMLLPFIFVAFMFQTNFLGEQKKYERVRTALKDKEKTVAQNLKVNNIVIGDLNILIVVYKADKQLELFAKKKTETAYKKIKIYDICASSGILGPKRRQGDNQVPEGLYHISKFNPASNYYLSLGVNYPNEADRQKSKAANLGGDIFIHGSCMTIGCLPMTDDKIKEIYLYALYARNNGQLKIPVYVFPYKMTTQNCSEYTAKFKRDVELLTFWANLKSGYDKFEKEKKELKFLVNRSGDYTFL